MPGESAGEQGEWLDERNRRESVYKAQLDSEASKENENFSFVSSSHSGQRSRTVSVQAPLSSRRVWSSVSIIAEQ
uniref:Uncharacterized protein n=1 Tax=Ditylenchus dipsaci TaxID=166011 RepID=A0A915DIN3_9BILA